VALAIDRVVGQRATLESAKRERARLGELQKALIDAINRNATVLRSLANLRGTAITHASGLEMAIWEVWKADVIHLVKDSVLRGDVALYFEDLERVDALNRELVRLYTSGTCHWVCLNDGTCMASLDGASDQRMPSHGNRIV